MHCPKCMSETTVITTAQFTDGTRRRHKCRNAACGHRFNTAQVIYGRPFAVCKGQRMKWIAGEPGGDGHWVTAKTLRALELESLRHKRSKFTAEERRAFIMKSLFPDRTYPKPAEPEGQDDG